jgi:hypothetical protein
MLIHQLGVVIMTRNLNKKQKQTFHAVDFMREVRNELTQQFIQDKPKYLDYLKKVMEDFKSRQKKVYSL